MPSYRSISISLQSQNDAERIPEFHPPDQGHDKFRKNGRKASQSRRDTASSCSVYIPVVLGTAFWLRYSVSPPVPNTHYFLFKLYINGVRVVNWCAGEKENWQGKVMFGLYEGPEDERGKRTLEKMLLRFTVPSKKKNIWSDILGNEEKMCMEIKVHRGHARKRIAGDWELCKLSSEAKKSGENPTERKKRFYELALIDPVDQPFATFKYHYRTLEQIRSLALLDYRVETESGVNNFSIIEPSEEITCPEDTPDDTEEYLGDHQSNPSDCGENAVV